MERQSASQTSWSGKVQTGYGSKPCTFFVMAMFGFTLNNLTLFGLVLAVGIVVDDAIVVVENV